MRIAVVGASGFVGRSVLAAAVAAGHSVAAIARAGGAAARETEWRAAGDFERVTDWPSVLRDVDSVIYLAARVHVMNEQSPNALAAYRAINRDVALCVAEAAAAGGARRFVYLSTIKVHGERTVGRPIDESWTIDPQGPYARSKADAEEALAALAARTGLSCVAVRPPLVLGPGAAGNVPRLRQLARIGARVPLPLGGIENRRSYVFREHLADAVVRLATHAAPLRAAYVASDASPVSTPELIRQVGAALGLHVRLARVPENFLRLAGALTGLSEEVQRLVDSLDVRSDALRQDLRWETPTQLPDVLAATFAGPL